MTSRAIRRQFLDFFASKGHKIIPSAPMVAKSDPTLMFINSGMAPLKDFFLGNQTPPSKRVADTQKCLRVSGKHNDLEDVGMDGYHHTMFEMLGNWSFGDYFKKEALAWSWELLTEVYKIPKDRLYVSIFEGNEAEGVPFDQEAFDVWRTMLPEERILKFGKKENFWEMGDQGPCGPCSEIHVDLRSDADRAKVDGRGLVNADDPNVIEVWNNVFMQFNRKADGSLEELPAKSVDTGMGFERLCRAVQGARSNYDTDLWKPLFDFLGDLAGHYYDDTYPAPPGAIDHTGNYPGNTYDFIRKDIAMRVVADHLRAVSFAIADGEMPSNTGAGYVIRRILRRAVRYYYSVLEIKEPVMYRMAPILAEEFHDVFPELKAQIDFVSKVILEEEKGFLRTLESGLKRFENIEIQGNTLGGAQAFELYDTFGFPYDLTALLAKEKGWKVDETGFKIALQEQKDRSRKDAVKQVGDWMVLRDSAAEGGSQSEVEFVGYDELETSAAHVVKYRAVTAKGAVQYQIVLNRTPFYPEGGGQVGDTGWMIFDPHPASPNGGGIERVRVLDTKKENTLIYHIVEKLPENIDDSSVRCEVDEPKRRLTEANHSATHLLHAALRSVLGTHVQQKGSFLNEDTLRFDFQHFQKVSEEEIARIETIVNQKIRENIALEEARNLPIEEAQKSGAMMLFGEKYGETVRMITFDQSYSRELCGGCHVQQTGQIGYFKITAETAIAAGVRRIEAVTAKGAEQYVAGLENEIASIKNVLKAKDLTKGIVALQDENKQLQKTIERMVQEQANGLRAGLRTKVVIFNGVQFLAEIIPIGDANAVKNLAVELEREIGNAVIAFGSVSADGKPSLTIKISDQLVKEKGLNAGTIVRELALKFLKGGGGGQPGFATAGGTEASGLPDAVAAVQTYL
jgi:alanyl-tRNA synthetase